MSPLSSPLPSRVLPLPSHAQSPLVVKLTIHDTIQPITAEYLKRGLDDAAARHAAAVLISMGTPGGLLDSTREMVANIEASPVPVIIFIEPSGSRAGSAGFFLLESADVAAMAPGTEAGAAHPILEGTTMDPVLKEKIENDAAAFLRSYVTVRGRDAKDAEDAVRNSKSFSESEALKLNLIDAVAPDDDALLAQLDGRTIKRFNGASRPSTSPTPPSTRSRPPRASACSPASPAPTSTCFFSSAAACSSTSNSTSPEPSSPARSARSWSCSPSSVSTCCPSSTPPVLLLFAALALMVLEAKFASHGVLGIAGILCLVFGLATLVNGPTPEMRVHFGVAAGAGVGFGVVTFGLAWIAFKARQAKRLTGPHAMLGHTAVAMTLRPRPPAGYPHRPGRSPRRNLASHPPPQHPTHPRRHPRHRPRHRQPHPHRRAFVLVRNHRLSRAGHRKRPGRNIRNR